MFEPTNWRRAFRCGGRLWLEGIVAKRRAGRIARATGLDEGEEPGYWRRESEIEAMRRRRDVERLNPARV